VNGDGRVLQSGLDHFFASMREVVARVKGWARPPAPVSARAGDSCKKRMGNAKSVIGGGLGFSLYFGLRVFPYFKEI